VSQQSIGLLLEKADKNSRNYTKDGSAEPVRLGISQLSLLNGAATEDHQENSIRQIELILLLRILYFSALESRFPGKETASLVFCRDDPCRKNRANKQISIGLHVHWSWPKRLVRYLASILRA